MTLSGYFTSKSVLVPALLDSEGSNFKDNCVKSDKAWRQTTSGKNVDQ